MLREIAVKNAKPERKAYRLFDERGLYLEVSPKGSKYWRFKYRFAGKEKRLAFGVYPDVGLADARKKREAARNELAAGKDPGSLKREAKRLNLLNSENTFEVIAREWYEKRKHEWVTNYSEKMIVRLEAHIFPRLGNRPIADIRAPELLSVLRVVEGSGALDLTRRLKQTCAQIFMYAIATGRAERNPVPDIQGALKTPVQKNRAYLKPEELPDYLKKLEAYDGDKQTQLALKLLLLTFVRTTELRAASWSEINFDAAEWRIPAERMKMKEQHIVPLSKQAIAVLQEQQKHSGNRQYIFPNRQNPRAYMSENTMLFGLYRMGYHSKATGHGFRSSASTVLNENGFLADVIERQLAHGERDKVRAAYNHAQYLSERRKMMQWWADYLDAVAKKAPK